MSENTPGQPEEQPRTFACHHAPDTTCCACAAMVRRWRAKQPTLQVDLTPHLRQFMHNDGSGFVFGYDKEGIDRLFAELQGAKHDS